MTRDDIQAAFEAGIKLGALYHQWVGTPISPDTAKSVETAIANAVALQPCVDAVSVTINTEMMEINPFGYSELAGKMLEVEIQTTAGDATCTAALKYDGEYPLMEILDIR
ncbi:dihydroneopterin aldolase family protein [Methanogenium sp. MK-MG]|uniref:dihydroneopterin aldolase family protein n=1 Tax=Methanogenium sp. MK-MG TaxID=2599926 RepID=UPI0013EC8D1C|nr:dihydroneopterin aldolase family protein [Methanogenium sp. MK-MG]KAF1078371.1 Dihydroneopterin aldolase [Methanogenium sp. MK-MG]